ncbi:MAG TPA: M20/M25/M40 family metallo-hydrolase [Chitinophagaceae bacterium]|nr:M20/M25/M40 family metallo-hydrolase [Chitinophagaceae bacterium]
MKKIITAAFILLASKAFSQQADYLQDSVFIRKVANNILPSRASYNNLFYLTKKIGGRLAGSPQMVMAEQWGYKALQQAGADKVTLQECMVPHWVRRGIDKTTITFRNNNGALQAVPLTVTALGNSVGTGSNGVKAQVVRVNNFDELEAKKNDLKGKIVFYNVPFDDTLVSTFSAYAKNVIYRGIGASRAAKYGAVAVLVRSMTNAMDNAAHTGSLHYLDSLPKIPAVAVGVRDVEKMDALIDEGKELTAQMFTYGKMLPDTIGHNVIGELTGSEYPGEIITVGGHLDAWDITEGATDDGAGIVQTIEILRAFKALGFTPKHTIRFVLFANEENGARGGQKYAAEAKANNEKHIFALESDAGGFTPRYFSLPIDAQNEAKLAGWKKLLQPYLFVDFVNGGGGTDVGPLNKELNIPVGEMMPDNERYFDVHHSRNDVLENVNIRELKIGAINMAALLYLIDKYGF